MSNFTNSSGTINETSTSDQDYYRDLLMIMFISSSSVLLVVLAISWYYTSKYLRAKRTNLIGDHQVVTEWNEKNNTFMKSEYNTIQPTDLDELEQNIELL